MAHRRCGKTVACINDLLKHALFNERKNPAPRYAYVAPTYAQAKDVAWTYLKHYSGPATVEARESDLLIRYINGATIRLYGADNYDRMRGLYFDGMTIDEPAQIDPAAWPTVLRPTLADYQGWATFIGTPKGRDWFYAAGRLEKGELDPNWFHATLKASETGVLPESELDDQRKTLTPEQYEQEYECSFEAAIVGAYYGKLISAAENEKPPRITGVAYEPTAQVWTAWDLGIRDATAIWFAQAVGREIHIIDYYEASGVDFGHYVREIMNRPYIYAGHIVPHDAQAREQGTGKTRLETLESLGLKNLTIAPMHRVEDGINAVRVFIPKCWFDATKCYRGVEALKLYHAEYDERFAILRPQPVHDWTSHAADAFRYLAMTLDRHTKANKGPINYPNLGYY